MPLPNAAEIITSIFGQSIPSSSMAGKGLQWYEDRFAQFADIHWNQFGPQWDAGTNIAQYESGMTMWEAWVRTGDIKYYNRAIDYVVNFRDQGLQNGTLT